MAMKTIAEILPLLKEQVKQGTFESEEEAVSEYKLMRERNER